MADEIKVEDVKVEEKEVENTEKVEDTKVELNKAGDLRGKTNSTNFKNNKQLASKAGKKANKKKAAPAQAIIKSPAIATGRNKMITD